MKIMYIIPNFNLYGGTPKKTLDLMKHFQDQSVLYVYHNQNSEFKSKFMATGGKLYDGFYGRNILKHIIILLKIIDKENINVVQTQFSMGETLGFLIKILRPKVKLIIAFVGPFQPSFFKKSFALFYYKKVDIFIYITKYIQTEKFSQFPILKKMKGVIINNGTAKRIDNGKEIIKMKKYSLLDVAGLVDWKNIKILIRAINILINQKSQKNIYLYIAGEGPQLAELENLIKECSLTEYIFLLGYQTNIGRLLNTCDIFVHPALAEGFGIAVAEAMHAEKPIIISNAGALPELIEHERSGLIVDPYNAEDWADAILRIIHNNEFSRYMGNNARVKAERDFSYNKFVSDYERIYLSLTH